MMKGKNPFLKAITCRMVSLLFACDKGDKILNKLMKECNSEARKALKEYKGSLSSENMKC